jgi:hypothetical protein
MVKCGNFLFIFLELVLAVLARCLGWQGLDFQAVLCSKKSIFDSPIRAYNNGLLKRWRIVSLDGNLT